MTDARRSLYAEVKPQPLWGLALNRPERQYFLTTAPSGGETLARRHVMSAKLALCGMGEG